MSKPNATIELQHWPTLVALIEATLNKHNGTMDMQLPRAN